MTNLTLLLFGLLVFALMLTGLVLTMVGFHAVADRPDRVRGLPEERAPSSKQPGRTPRDSAPARAAR